MLRAPLVCAAAALASVPGHALQVARPDQLLDPVLTDNNLNFAKRIVIDGSRMVIDQLPSDLGLELEVFELDPASKTWLRTATVSPGPGFFGPNSTDLDLAGDLLAVADFRGPLSEATGTLYRAAPDGSWNELDLTPAPIIESAIGSAMDTALGDGWAAFEVTTAAGLEIGIYEPLGDKWILSATLPTPAPADRPIVDMAAQGDELFVLYAQADGPQAIEVWRRAPTGWTKAQFLPVPPGWQIENGDGALAVDGDLLVAGAVQLTDPLLRAKSFLEDPLTGTWAPDADLRVAAGQAFAPPPPLALHDRTTLVGSSGIGASKATVHDRSTAGAWLQRLTLAPPPGPQNPSGGFATAVAAGPDAFVIGDLRSNAVGFQSGQAYAYLRGTLYRDKQQLSLLQGGRQTLLLRPNLELAGQFHVILGSLSGTAPGLPLPNSTLVLPLTPDGYTNYSIATLGQSSAIVQSALGVLSPEAEANAFVAIPPALLQNLVGTTAHHAFFTLNASGVPTSVSNPVSLLLTP